MNIFFEKLSKLNWKIFLIGILMGMLAVLILNLKSSTRQSFKPLTANSQTIISKLSEKKHNYQLKSMQGGFISNAYASDFDIYASGYVVLDFDSGEILAEKNSSQILPIASLTKLMTGVVALDLAAPTEMFTISQNASDKPATKIGVVAGEKMSLEELLNAALLTSANDATQVIKEGINQKYNSDIFEKAMNQKAKILGLKNSSFSNPQGFDGKYNYSSARDFAILSHYALTNYPLIKKIVKKDYEFLPADNNHKQFDLYNWNGLLGVYPNVLGIKIGNTNDALYTTAVVSQRENKKVLVVLLGAPGVLERDLWSSSLLDIGFEKLGLPKIAVTENQLLEKYSTWQYWN